MLQKKEDNRRDYYSWRYRSSDDDDDKPDSDFRVEADIENNRLLLYANKAELEAVNSLLVKLGELPGDSGNPNTIRVQDARGEKTTADLLIQLKRLWPESANPLKIEGTLPTSDVELDEPSETSDQKTDSVDSTEPVNDSDAEDTGKTANRKAIGAAMPATFAMQTNASASTSDDQPLQHDARAETPDETTPSDAPPINISIAADGRLILSSQDTAALDTLEELIGRLAPPAKKHRVFYLQYALASLVTLNLEEYFEGDTSTDSDENWMRAWFGMDFKEETVNNGLSSRRPVRFIYDIDTNSILVRDATPRQMETIEELIEIYDQAPSEESISARRLKAFKLEYSDANVVAATIKDVFRDLLSSKDKEFVGTGEKENQSSSSRTIRLFGGNDKDDKPTKVKASFEGALSVGVDALSNTIIVSAQEEWMPNIEEIIKYLDENAKPDTTVVVQPLKMPMNADSMQALAAMLRPWPGNKKPEDTPKRKGKGKAEQRESPMPTVPETDSN